MVVNSKKRLKQAGTANPSLAKKSVPSSSSEASKVATTKATCHGKSIDFPVIAYTWIDADGEKMVSVDVYLMSTVQSQDFTVLVNPDGKKLIIRVRIPVGFFNVNRLKITDGVSNDSCKFTSMSEEINRQVAATNELDQWWTLEVGPLPEVCEAHTCNKHLTNGAKIHRFESANKFKDPSNGEVEHVQFHTILAVDLKVARQWKKQLRLAEQSSNTKI